MVTYLIKHRCFVRLTTFFSSENYKNYNFYITKKNAAHKVFVLIFKLNKSSIKVITFLFKKIINSFLLTHLDFAHHTFVRHFDPRNQLRRYTFPRPRTVCSSMCTGQPHTCLQCIAC